MINKKELPPRGRSSAIFLDNTDSFFMSIHDAMSPHNKNTPRAPARNALPGRWYTNSAIKKEAMAMIHHPNHNPPAKASNAVKTIATINFILLFLLYKLANDS